MLGIALEGGGARGAYHIGVYRAYMENGHQFDGFVGTSIGAINAAAFAQGDYDKVRALWMDLSMDRLFDADEQALIDLGNLQWSAKTLAALAVRLGKTIKGGGINTSKMRALIAKCVDEERVRSAGKLMGLVCVSIEELKPYRVYLPQIPQGQLIDYLMASASFPGFAPARIDGKPFIDGGVYDNCPIGMLCEKGFDEVVAVRTFASGRFKRVGRYSDVRIQFIEPSEDLGNVMIFSHDRIERNMQLGYFDGLRAIKGLWGQSYYLCPAPKLDFLAWLQRIDDEHILEAGVHLGIPGISPKRLLFERIVPRLGEYLGLNDAFDYRDFVIAVLEYRAGCGQLERLKIYDFDELTALAKGISDQALNAYMPSRLESALKLLEAQRACAFAIDALIRGAPAP